MCSGLDKKLRVPGLRVQCFGLFGARVSCYLKFFVAEYPSPKKVNLLNYGRVI